MNISFTINGQPAHLDVDENTPLLWIVRDTLGLQGSKFGCGKGACGACTVLVDGAAIRSCSYPVKNAAGKNIITIEGLGEDGQLHPVQQAWMEAVVPQCGYCQSGFIMATVALLEENPAPSDQDIDAAISNICRCGTYYRMRKAIHRAAALIRVSTLNQPS